jgi:hypothetical protein
MNFEVIGLVKVVFAWILVGVALGSYFFVWKRVYKNPLSWVTVAVAWIMLVLIYTLISLGLAGNTAICIFLLMLSYVSLMTSVTLLFLELVRIFNGMKTQSFNQAVLQNVTQY